MTDGSDALFGTFPAARTKRIGSDIDIVATMLVLVGEPRHIRRLQNLLQSHDPLCGSCGILSAKQDRNGLFRGETTSEETDSYLTHGGTFCECGRAGFSRKEARLSPGFCMEEMAYAATSCSVISSNSSS